jgi:hypothetical protein
MSKDLVDNMQWFNKSQPQAIDDSGIHLLRCLCGSERIATHDTL